MTESNPHPLSPEKLAAELADQAVSAQEVAPSGEPDAVSPAAAPEVPSAAVQSVDHGVQVPWPRAASALPSPPPHGWRARPTCSTTSPATRRR